MAKRPTAKYDFKAFGQAIKAARTERKESRKKVSDEMYISPRYLANIENKGQQPSLQIFYELVTRYDISVDQFFFPDKSAEKDTQRRQLDTLLDSMSEKGIRVVTATAKEIAEVETEDKEMADLVKEVNEGTKDAKAFTEKLSAALETVTDENAKAAIENTIKEIEEKNLDFLTGFMALEAEEGVTVEKNANGKYDVTIQIPILKDTLKDVNILYYNKELKSWEIIEPTAVDFEKQTIEFEVEDFSLLAVLANVENAE